MYAVFGGDVRQNILAAGFIGILILLGYIGILIMSGYFWYYLWNAARLVGKRPLHYVGLSFFIPVGPVIAYSMLKKASTEYYNADTIAHQGKGFAIIWGTIVLIAVIGVVAAVIIPQVARQQQKPEAQVLATEPISIVYSAFAVLCIFGLAIFYLYLNPDRQMSWKARAGLIAFCGASFLTIVVYLILLNLINTSVLYWVLLLVWLFAYSTLKEVFAIDQ
jgi:hypothetical protein